MGVTNGEWSRGTTWSFDFRPGSECGAWNLQRRERAERVSPRETDRTEAKTNDPNAINVVPLEEVTADGGDKIGSSNVDGVLFT